MAKIITGNLLDVKTGIIIQQVNCQGVMGSGVAKALYEKWPKIKQTYLWTFKDKPDPSAILGRYDLTTLKVAPPLAVVNSYTQLTYGRTGHHTNEALLIRNIRAIAESYSMYQVYVPMLIGCGLGGGDWDQVYAGIKDIPNLVIVELPKEG